VSARVTCELHPCRRLREGVLREIHLDAVNGIICFPSLHAAVAVIVPFTLRWNKPLFCAVVVLDSIMFLSAGPSGNHYFADVLGGIMVATAAIAASGPIQVSLARLMRTRVSSIREVRVGSARMPAQVKK